MIKKKDGRRNCNEKISGEQYCAVGCAAALQGSAGCGGSIVGNPLVKNANPNWIIPLADGKEIVDIGNVDGDEEVSAKDALWVLQAVVKLRILNEDQRRRADGDCDGKITVNDALQILRFVVRL